MVNDKLGRTKLNVGDLCSPGQAKRQWISLFSDGELSTELLIITKYEEKA
jgi:hypothetical protein